MSVETKPIEKSSFFNSWYKSHRQRPWMRSLEVLVRHPLAQIGFTGFMLVTLITILAPVIAPYDPVAMDFGQILTSPSSTHPFGTDDLGRDVLSRVLYGGRESMRAGYFAILIGLSGGVVIGLITGYFGGLIDDIVQRIIEIFWAFPTILLVFSVIAAFGPNLGTVIVVIGLASIPGYSRLFRGSVIQAKNFEYVTAAKIVGSRAGRIMFKHILPNIISPILIYGTLDLAGAIMMTAGLSYLGMGAQPPSPEWGAMLNYGREYLRIAPWMSFYPGLAIFLTMLSVNLFGNGLRDALDPRTRKEKAK